MVVKVRPSALGARGTGLAPTESNKALLTATSRVTAISMVDPIGTSSEPLAAVRSLPRMVMVCLARLV